MEKPVFFPNKSEIPANARIVDAYSGAVEELFFIKNPKFKKSMPEAEARLKQFLETGNFPGMWIYFPWSNTAVHTVDEESYFLLRTSRNRNIITADEQIKYRGLSVGIAGLSVGSCILNALTVSGGPQQIKIADFDTLEISNLNRIRGNITQVGQNKTHIAAQAVWELDPFAKLDLFEKGLTIENLSDFLFGQPKLDVFIDEMDSLDLKIHARISCKQHKVPVLMATDNGDGIILDIERFDLEPDRPLFHGLIEDIKPEELKHIDYKVWLKLATRIVGPDYLTERMQDSLLVIGKELPAVPQLGTTASLAGTAMAFALRRIANQQELPSGRYTLGLEEKLIPNYSSQELVLKRKEHTGQFKESFSKAS
jgi:hypothetical protein